MMDATENVGVALGEEKTVKRKGRKLKMKKSLSATENVETDGEKLAGETKDSVRKETKGDNIASYDRGIDLDTTRDAVASCSADEEKKSNKKKKRSKKKKAVLGTEGENMACQTQNKGMEQITGNNVIEGTDLHNQNDAHLGENICKLETLIDTKKKDVCADDCATASEVTVLDDKDTCKKKWKKRERKLSSVSQLDLNDVDRKDGNIESRSVNDGESNHSREGNNVNPGEGLPLTGFISSSISIKGVFCPVSNGEANLEKLLNPSPKGQCGKPPSRKLLILDINGLLADIVSPVPFGFKPDLMLSRKAVFKRPFCESFLQFCLEKFDVGVWSSRVKINVDNVLNFLMGEMKNKLVFYWDRSHCTITRFRTIENKNKPLVLKELGKLWDDHQFHLGKYDHWNTLLLDDSPYKALCNPADTAIFPLSYQYSDINDCSLGPGSDLRVYLERLAMADNIPEFVRKNHFGQRPIRETNMSWNYYKKVIDSRNSLGKQ